jgi:hypothetical protein
MGASLKVELINGFNTKGIGALLTRREWVSGHRLIAQRGTLVLLVVLGFKSFVGRHLLHVLTACHNRIHAPTHVS